MSLLELKNIVIAYGKVESLKGLTLRVEKGEIVTLLGSNGAGKSTTLRTISGLIHPLSGTMRFLGQPIDRLSPEAIVRLGVAHVPERRRVFPGLTVRVQQVFQIIAGIRAQGTTVLLVEQNAHMALSIGDRGYVLETGRLVAEGTPEALWNNDELRAAYLGGRKMVR